MSVFHKYGFGYRAKTRPKRKGLAKTLFTAYTTGPAVTAQLEAMYMSYKKCFLVLTRTRILSLNTPMLFLLLLSLLFLFSKHAFAPKEYPIIEILFYKSV